MKILEIVSTLNKGDGITNVFVKYFSKIKSKNIVFDFLCIGCTEEDKANNYYKKYIEECGGHVYYISSPLNIYKFKKEWKLFCKNYYNNFDILENNIPFLGVFFKNAKKKLGVKKIITHAHASKYGDSTYTNFRNYIFMRATGYCLGDYLFATSLATGKQIFKKQIYKKPFYIVNDAFDLNKFKFKSDVRERVRKKYNWNNKIVIGNVGRFTPQKNHRLIVEVFAKFLQVFPDSKLVLIGDGYLVPKIKEQIKRLGIANNVQLLGVRTDVDKLLQGMDAFIFPSNFEGLGVALVEAEVVGLPSLISNNVPREAIINKNVLVLSLKAPVDNWVEGLKKIIKYKRECNGLLNAENIGFDVTVESNKLSKIYKKIVGEVNDS